MTQYRHIIKNGLWTNNPGLVQLLGLCPLLAMSNTLINGLGLGLATIVVLVLSNLSISVLRRFIPQEIRLPAFVVIIACLVTVVELIMHAYWHALYQILGIFIPLIITNCAIIGRAETFASRNRPLPALVDGLMMGLGFTLVLVTLGALRELLGAGTLFDQAHLMFGEAARGLTLQLTPDKQLFLLMLYPPGAFLCLGFLLAAKNIVDQRVARAATHVPLPVGNRNLEKGPL